MSSHHLQDNPLWLYLGSFLLFSLLCLFFIGLHPVLAPRQILPEPRTRNVIPTVPPKMLSIAISSLQQKTYIPVTFTTEQHLATIGNFTSSVISFSLDGLKEYARLNVPISPEPKNGFPVIILDHGYIVPSQYSTVSSYNGVESFFASNGFIVIKPDYRGNGNSEGAGDALQRYNYPVDVLTLIASIRNIPHADKEKIYLWGHSMGGEVTLTVLEILGKQPTLATHVKAAVLWAPVTDPVKWFSRPHISQIPEANLTPFPYAKTFQILGQPSENSPTWQSINPLNFLSDITIPLQLNHGTADSTVPYSWSQELVEKMKTVGKTIDFISYEGADHNLVPVSTQALQNNLAYFKKF